MPGFLKNSCASFSCCASDWRIKARGCWFSSWSWSRTCFLRGGWLASRGSCVLERLPETGWKARKGELTAFELLASGSRLLDMLDRADRVAMYRWCAGGAVSLCWTALHATRTRSTGTLSQGCRGSKREEAGGSVEDCWSNTGEEKGANMDRGQLQTRRVWMDVDVLMCACSFPV